MEWNAASQDWRSIWSISLLVSTLPVTSPSFGKHPKFPIQQPQDKYPAAPERPTLRSVNGSKIKDRPRSKSRLQIPQWRQVGIRYTHQYMDEVTNLLLMQIWKETPLQEKSIGLLKFASSSLNERHALKTLDQKQQAMPACLSCHYFG